MVKNTIYADNKMVVTFTEDDTEYGPDMIDVITYNVEDAKNVMSRSAEMEKEFNKHIPSKVENIDPRNYVINMLSNIYEELEELFVKQNEHIKVLLTSGAGKTDITPLAILDYKSKTSEAVNGYDLMVALDCLIPNLSKEGLEHFIDVAQNVLKMKDFDHE